MYNLVMKDLKLGISPWFLALPLFTGALMLIPGWVYFLVPMYFCFITVPNMFGGFKSQHDLLFSTMMPVTKKDIVKARFAVIVVLELLHLLIAMIFGAFTLRLYPNLTYIFFAPHPGFWGLCFVMLAIFNLILLPMYYKTAYKYGAATTVSSTAAILFALAVQWAGIRIAALNDIFYGPGTENTGLQLSILLAGVLVFTAFTLIAYRVSARRFLKVEII
ncbi:ABC-2 transporter permease [Saccharibacillus sp. CPCC 101409]|uniref:ABC-2 transporter permease n=1 Tax=Saccharibacillus sp. CPCC 101409 TaxID=3058041 RepID=UPI0026736E71|nr:ABC-2 transporter permease [Saccharibacillus sp. CPCC 101409]MDO3409763.1 ABC-2 transporter permease [Saccharibacillus sp. CPCC 101409]